MAVLITGTAGFIGSHLAHRLLDDGLEVIGVDNLSPYYDVSLKEARLARLTARPGFTDIRLDLSDRAGVAALFDRYRPDYVVHLAAQAGVRYSLQAPFAYADANLVGFLTVLEGCRAVEARHLVYASTSSVYGANRSMPFSPHQSVAHPMSLYAATKLANEAMAHSYSHLFGMPCTGLRLFTVYGPWGRPDMALFRFTEAILEGRPIPVFNQGDMRRDFTFVADIVAGIAAVLKRPPAADAAWDPMRPDPAASGIAPFRVLNIGNSAPTDLRHFIAVLEDCLGRKATLDLLPMQPGDVQETWADMSDLEELTRWRPDTPVEVGIPRFVDWYRSFYGK